MNLQNEGTTQLFLPNRLVIEKKHTENAIITIQRWWKKHISKSYINNKKRKLFDIYEENDLEEARSSNRSC